MLPTTWIMKVACVALPMIACLWGRLISKTMEGIMAVRLFHIANGSYGGASLKVFACLAVFALCAPISGLTSDKVPDAEILNEVQQLYGLSKHEAVDRMAREAEARRIHHALRDHMGSAWAKTRTHII